MRIVFTILISACLLTLFAGCFGIMDPLVKETLTLTLPHVDQKPLKVESSNGSIHVVQTQRSDIEVLATIRATSIERLQQVEIIHERSANGELTIKALWPDKRHSREGCRFEIAIPNVRDLNLRSSNGRLRVSGSDGMAKLKTSNGKITVEDHRGDLDAETSNGTISARGVIGNLKLKCSNGRIEAQDVQGQVDGQTSNGSITLGLAAPFRGTLDLKTSNGSIKIADDLEDRVVSRDKKKRATLQFGNGPSSRARTSNGSITIEAVP